MLPPKNDRVQDEPLASELFHGARFDRLAGNCAALPESGCLASTGARYDLQPMLTEAALAGLGAALVPRLYIESELEQGRLLAAWPEGKTDCRDPLLGMPEHWRWVRGHCRRLRAGPASSVQDEPSLPGRTEGQARLSATHGSMLHGACDRAPWLGAADGVDRRAFRHGPNSRH